MSLEKAAEFLPAVPSCLDQDWYNSAVSGAYFLIFQAARTAFAAVRIERPWWNHGNLQADFSKELVRRWKLYPASFVPHVAEAMELRHLADYSDSPVSRRRALTVVRTASEFIMRVKEEVGDA